MRALTQLLCCLLLGGMLSAQTLSGLVVTQARGTGRTTGHIADLSIYNPTDATLRLVPASFYIPMGHSGHQPYAGNTPDGVDIPPGTTLTVPVDGYCLDVHSPPVPAGEAMPGYESWVQIGDPADLITTYANNHPGLEHLPGLPVGSTFVPAYDPSQAITLINSPAFEPSAPQPATVSLTFPGTDIPITGHFDIHEDPLSTAPLLIAITEVMTDAALTVQQSGSHPTPFAGNPDRELDALTQQGLWIVMGALTGEAYTQEDFQQNTYTQFTENTGQSVDDLPETAKEQLDSGVNDFWDAFTAVGVEAKVLRSEETTAPEAIPINNEEETDLRPRGCPSDMTVNLNPPYDFDMVIAPEWGSAEERRATIDTVRAMLERDLSVTTEDALVTYDINRHPTSSTSFWKGGNIGGFASARAKTWFRTDDGWDWVWGTPRMATHAGGTMDYTLAYTPDEGCSATVAGVALIRVRASSEAFDAMAGNRQDENDTDQLQFLRGTQYLGKKATEWLILRGRGRTTKSFQRFVTDDLKDQVEGQITEAIQEEATRLAEQALNALLDEMGLDLNIADIELPDFELPNVKELLEEALGIEIPDIEQWISDGIDAAWNLFFVANTYATADGFLVVHVGGESGSARASTRVHYARQSTEETADAMTWTGEMCQEALVADARPNALTIHTEGQVDMVAEAMSRFGFGNGSASAFLESMNLQILAGICVCRAQRMTEDDTYSVEVGGQLDWYTADKSQQAALQEALTPLLDTIQTDLEAAMAERFRNRQYSGLPEAQMKSIISERVAAWAEEHPFAWMPCERTE